MAKQIENWVELFELIKGLEIGDTFHVQTKEGIFKLTKVEHAPMKVQER